MGGSNPATTKMPSGYSSNLMRSLRLGNGLTSAAIASTPELRTFDINGLQTMARREALINAIESKKLEETVSPDVARTRVELSKQIADDLEGGPSVELSNMWLKQGLADAIATGADTGSGFARSAIADSTRSDFIADRDRVQGKAGALLAANPQPEAGIDPGALASMDVQTKSDNANARDAWKTSVLAALGNQAGNATNAMQQYYQMVSGVEGQNAQAKNAASGSNSALWGNLAGAGIGAGAALGGTVLLAF